jgi:hypothetical protein
VCETIKKKTESISLCVDKYTKKPLKPTICRNFSRRKYGTSFSLWCCSFFHRGSMNTQSEFEQGGGMAAFPLLDLPDDVQQVVMSHLSARTLCSLMICCRSLYDLAQSDAVWAALLARDFSAEQTNEDESAHEKYQLLAASKMFVFDRWCIWYRNGKTEILNVHNRSSGMRILLTSSPPEVVFSSMQDCWMVNASAEYMDPDPASATFSDRGTTWLVWNQLAASLDSTLGDRPLKEPHNDTAENLATALSAARKAQPFPRTAVPLHCGEWVFELDGMLNNCFVWHPQSRIRLELRPQSNGWLNVSLDAGVAWTTLYSFHRREQM